VSAADRVCRPPWELVAATGRVESDHGRHKDSTLGSDGISRPGILGIPLDGRRYTIEIKDYDAACSTWTASMTAPSQ
jgi:hypothetical protein